MDPVPENSPIRVVLVDDHPLVRAGLRTLLEADGIGVVGEAADGADGVELVRELSPDVTLMDLSMPGLDGAEATRRLTAAGAQTRVVVLTSYADRDRVHEALDAGAIGYLLKDSEPALLWSSVRSAAAGHSPIDPRVAGVLLPGSGGLPPATGSTDGGPAATSADLLSAREHDVLRLLAQGMANKQIARRLDITERTVKAHLGNIYRAIGVGDRTSAALWARDHLS